MATKQLYIRVYRWGIHRGEESLVDGNDRSGVFYLSGCHLKCSFCYTPETSMQRLGMDLLPSQLEALYHKVLTKGAKNINLISPTHYWARIAPTLRSLREKRKDTIVLKISGYESLPLIRSMLLDADVLVPDFKVANANTALKYQLPKDYGTKTLAAISLMQDLIPNNHFRKGKLVRGFLIRHLIMPNELGNSFEVIEQLAQIKFKGILNLMTGFIHPKGGLDSAPHESIAQLVSLAQSYQMTVLRNGAECETTAQKTFV